MVDLPAFDAGTASTIASSLLQIARSEKRLPAAVVAARDALASAEAALAVELRKQLVITAAPEAAPDADPEDEEDAAWTGCEAWLGGLLQLPSSSDKPAIAAKLHRTLFSDGVRFLRGAARKTWSETTRRLDLIKSEKLAADFTTLGGDEVLATLVAKHAAVGQALGFTAPLPTVETPQVRARFDALKTALRYYILQVAATAHPGEPATVTFSEHLLAPITSYEPPVRARAERGDKPTVTPPPAAAPPAKTA